MAPHCSPRTGGARPHEALAGTLLAFHRPIPQQTISAQGAASTSIADGITSAARGSLATCWQEQAQLWHSYKSTPFILMVHKRVVHD